MAERKAIDVERCLSAMEDINIEGLVDSVVRRRAISVAIQEIAEDGDAALKEVYVAVLSFASNGEGIDRLHYGQIPDAGIVRFNIRRKKDVTLGGDHIYLLECVRDFTQELRSLPTEMSFSQNTSTINLCGVLRERSEHLSRLQLLDEALDNSAVESVIYYAETTLSES